MSSRELLKGTFHYGISEFVFKAVAFFTFPIFAAIFSVEEFGIVELLVSGTALLIPYYSLGLNFALLRNYWDNKYPSRESIVSTCLISEVIWGIAFSALLLTGFYLFRDVLKAEFQLPFRLIFFMVIGNLPLIILELGIAVLRSAFKSKEFLILSFFRNIVRVGLQLFLVLVLDWGIEGFILGLVISYLLAVPLLLVFLRKQLTFKWDKRIFRDFFSYGMPVMLSASANWVNESLDRWMLSGMTNNFNVGLYSVAAKITIVLLFLYQAFGMVFFPYAMKMIAERQDYREHMAKLFSYWMSLNFILVLGLVLFSREILAVLTPERYREAYSSIAILAIAYWIFAGQHFASLGVHIKKKTSVFIPIAWTVAGVNFLLNLILIHQLKQDGAALATVCSNLVSLIILFVISGRLHHIPYQLSRVSILFLSLVLVMYLTIFVFPAVTPFWLIAAKTSFLLLAIYILEISGLVSYRAAIDLIVQFKGGGSKQK